MMLVLQVLGEIIIIHTIGMLLIQKPPTDVFIKKIQTCMPLIVIIILTHTMAKNIATLIEVKVIKNW